MAIVNYTQHRYNGSSWDDLYPKTQASQVENLINTIYPVGSIYMSAVSTSPATLFGTGTWVAIGQGRVLMGVGTGTDGNGVSQNVTAGATGGEYKHTLSVQEMPTHDHLSHSCVCQGAENGWIVMRSVNRSNQGGSYEGTSTSGSSTAHNNIQPYLGVYMWQRTA